MEVINKNVDYSLSESRLDKAVCECLPGYTRSSIQKLILNGFVKVDGINREKNYVVKEGELISITIPPVVNLDVNSENIPLDIRYEDDDLLVVNKDKGMVVHPAPGNYEGTLVNALLYHCGNSLSGINGIIRPGIVHRIDKDTSGLLIVAKNDFSHRMLAEQIKNHSFKREYEAIVYGNIKEDTGTINLPIGRHPNNRKKMAVINKNSKEAVTHYEVQDRYGNFTKLKFILETGRTHQIRVHMAYKGHPLVGDEVYGPKNKLKILKGQCLHAKTIGFIHPRSKKYIAINSELPKYFIDFVKLLQSKSL